MRLVKGQPLVRRHHQSRTQARSAPVLEGLSQALQVNSEDQALSRENCPALVSVDVRDACVQASRV